MLIPREKVLPTSLYIHYFLWSKICEESVDFVVSYSKHIKRASKC